MQVLDTHFVLSASDEVFRDSGPASVNADCQVRQLIELTACGALIAVDEDFLDGIERTLFARIDWVLLAGLVARVIPIAVASLRDGGVILLQTADDLIVDFLLELSVRSHDCGEVVVFGFKVSQHLGILALVVAQPIPRILAFAKRRFNCVRFLRSDRRSYFFGCHRSHGSQHQSEGDDAQSSSLKHVTASPQFRFSGACMALSSMKDITNDISDSAAQNASIGTGVSVGMNPTACTASAAMACCEKPIRPEAAPA